MEYQKMDQIWSSPALLQYIAVDKFMGSKADS